MSLSDFQAPKALILALGHGNTKVEFRGHDEKFSASHSNDRELVYLYDSIAELGKRHRFFAAEEKVEMAA